MTVKTRQLDRTTVFDQGAPCPVCGKSMNAATPVAGEDGCDRVQPRPDDLTICAYCTAFLQFDAQMGLVLLNYEQIAELPADIRGALVRSRKILIRVNAERRQ